MNTTERFDLSCPTTNGPCPARERLHTLYIGDEEVEGDDEETSLSNKAKLALKLSEQALWAVGSGCEGAEGTTCPTRVTMNESKVRSTLVDKVRSIIHR